MTLEISLPPPWQPGTQFAFDATSKITWLVGPNGTGKSSFLRLLRDHPDLQTMKPRLVSTDRLSVVRPGQSMTRLLGSHFAEGINKSLLDQLVHHLGQEGAIASTVALLYRRPHLRIRVEAALSQLLDRHIRLEMADGALQPKARLGSGVEYVLFSEECHGVLELLTLLASIYDDESKMLLIDEPEQHLHPQYQAFVLQELRRSGKTVVLATHSPSLLSIRTLGELRGVLCFHPDFRAPSQYRSDAQVDREVDQVLPRMTEQHRAFFFAHHPVFVEGYFDCSMISSIQKSLGMSAEAAASSIIPCSGKDDAGRYLMLCNALGKKAAYVFDLDALFDQRLAVGASQNPVFAKKIAAGGHRDWSVLAGSLQRTLTDAERRIAEIDVETLDPDIKPLRLFIDSRSGDKHLNKRRLAILVALADSPEALSKVLGSDLDSLRGIFDALLEHLASVDIHVLPGGSLENYLPSYKGSRFDIPDEAKRQATQDEERWLFGAQRKPAEIDDRYRALASIVRRLPAQPVADVRPVLRRELADLLHRIIVLIRGGQIRTKDHMLNVLGGDWKRVSSFIEISSLTIKSPSCFSGEFRLLDKFAIGEGRCRFNENTQTNYPDELQLEFASENQHAAAEEGTCTAPHTETTC